MAEYDHMAELGLTEDTQLVCTDAGFITSNNPVRELCGRYIRDGKKFYDLLERYESLKLFSLVNDKQTGSVSKIVAPYLKAFGATDEDVYSFCRDNIHFAPDAVCCIDYLCSLLPTFLATGSYEHCLLPIVENTTIPLVATAYCSVSFDSLLMTDNEAKLLRELATSLTSCRLSDKLYSITDDEFFDREDEALIKTADICMEKMEKMSFFSELKKGPSMSSPEKGFALLELMRKKGITTENTAVIGTADADFHVLDMVREASGLAIAFNGNEYAVRGANISIIGQKPITALVLVNEFYNGGIESVYTMVENWNRESLKKNDCADRNLMDAFLKAHPKNLPSVKIITKSNRNSIIAESVDYRKKLRARKLW